MNLTTYHPLQSFDLLAIGIALVVVMGIIGMRIATGRPWRRTLPPDEVDASFHASFPATSTTRPRTATPATGSSATPSVIPSATPPVKKDDQS